MRTHELEVLLMKVKSGEIDIEAAVDRLADLPFTELGFATIDNHRSIRVGHPEVIYSEGKTSEQILKIVAHLHAKSVNILATRISEEAAHQVLEQIPSGRYNPVARTLFIENESRPISSSYIAIVAAGTTDLPVVEEAYETALALGNQAIKIIDVGVAGIHRLFAKLDDIKKAKVVIVVAGMEGALASVVGGLIDKPIIAVPTSVGYGANFGGISALLTMLNSCSSGVTVVNIDNGFGAAYAASQINRL